MKEMRVRVRTGYSPKTKRTFLSIRPLRRNAEDHQAGTVVLRNVLFSRTGILAEHADDFERTYWPRERGHMFSPVYWPRAWYNPRNRRYEDKDTGDALDRASIVYITSDGTIRYFQLGI